ncbi:tetratricopeptide repeat protein [Altericroceibacterium spongiae]|uniref:tetratricopeptide repeat protein n=1 Tax=Altericroceibacterium spongiae TaxID=2320269 RepID=UPI001EE5A35C|nr:tetratricopeptide repeat protein [Altericroceibacterium spongiae]
MNISGWAKPRALATVLAVTAIGGVALPSAAYAQDADARLRKIEAEVKALQRKVFPNSDGRFFTPEVNTAQTPPTQTIGTPSTSAISDILSRLDALEGQLRQLTARSEENSNKIAQLEEKLKQVSAAPLSGATTSGPSGFIPVPESSSGNSGSPAPTPAPASSSSVSRSAPSPARVEAVQAITKPSTDDAGDDEYVYGYRLWNEGYYPEAEQQLAKFLKAYPSHWRVSYGRNLLGRAYLDEGKPREAAPYFLQNYQSDKQGVRAPDSLLYLAESMIQMGDTNRACIALAEFGDTYPALATGRLQKQYERNRSSVTCQ